MKQEDTVCFSTWEEMRDRCRGEKKRSNAGMC